MKVQVVWDVLKNIGNGTIRQIITLIVIIVVGFIAYQVGVSRSETSGMIRHSGHVDVPEKSEAIYACSMHPEIQQSEPGNCPICGMELVLQQVKPQEKAKPLGYACAMNCVPPLDEPGNCPVCGMEMQPVYDGKGTSQSLSRRSFEMTKESMALAEIQTVRVEKKLPVREIRLFGRVEVDQTKRAHISLDVAGRLDALYADFEGAEVQKGDKLALLYSPELYATQKEYLQALSAIEAVSESTVPNLKTMMEETVRSTGERLRLAGMTPKQIEELAATGNANDTTAIYSPITGTVMGLNKEEGEYANKGEAILTIANLETLWVELEAFESDIQWIHEGQSAKYNVKSFPGESFVGEVLFLDPILDSKTRTIRVRLNLENSEGKVKPGMFVQGIIEGHLYTSPQLLIPDSSPLITGKRAVVYVRLPNRENPVFEGREVNLGPKTTDGYVVLDGLQEGEEVVVNGAFQIDSALQIMAKQSMMSPEGGGATGAHQHGDSTKMEMDMSDSHQEQQQKMEPVHLDQILPLYYNIHKALTEDDFDTAAKAYMSLHKATLDTVKLSEIVAKGMKATDISQQRIVYSELSNFLIAQIEKVGLPEGNNVYQAHCLMAFDNTGAYWLQGDEDLLNPYFGSEMLICGTIKKMEVHHD